MLVSGLRVQWKILVILLRKPLNKLANLMNTSLPLESLQLISTKKLRMQSEMLLWNFTILEMQSFKKP